MLRDSLFRKLLIFASCSIILFFASLSFFKLINLEKLPPAFYYIILPFTILLIIAISYLISNAYRRPIKFIEENINNETALSKQLYETIGFPYELKPLISSILKLQTSIQNTATQNKKCSQ